MQTAVIQHGGVDTGWRLVYEALVVQDAEYLGTLALLNARLNGAG